MSGGNTTQQQQSSTSNPWGPTQPLLSNMLGRLSGIDPSLTPDQANAGRTLNTEAANVPSLATPAFAGITGLLGGGNANAYAPMVQNAYSDFQGNLKPFTQSNYLDPMSNPYLGTALKTMNNDITNQVNSQFAASGNFGSPANATALARGLSQGEGGLLAGQFNTNVGTATDAAKSLYGAGTGAAGTLTGFNQFGNQNVLSGIGAAPSIPGLTMAPGAAQFGAANATAQQPFTNMSWLSSLLYPMATLGTQSQGTGTTTQQLSPLSTILGLTSGGLGLLGQMNGLRSLLPENSLSGDNPF